MTAHSELFVSEELRDEIAELFKDKEIGKLIDKGAVDVEVPKEWRDIWNESEYPASGEANLVFEDTDEPKTIGTVEWEMEFCVDDDGLGRYISAKAKNIRISVICDACKKTTEQLFLVEEMKKTKQKLWFKLKEFNVVCEKCLKKWGL